MYIKCYNNNYQKDKCLQEEEENCHLLKKNYNISETNLIGVNNY